jgi:hypothetical protein
MGSIDDARAILSTMMGAVATVLALILSVALLVLSMVSTLFGPRLLYRFLQDWVIQVTIGLSGVVRYSRSRRSHGGKGTFDQESKEHAGTRSLFDDWQGRFHTLGRRLLSTSSAR